MAEVDLPALERRARVAYERGRVWQALRVGLLVPPLFLAAFAPCQSASTVCIAGGLLLAAVVFFTWRGRDAGAAVLPGLAAGLIPFALPLGTRLIGHACNSSACMAICMPACCAGGALAGVALALFARAEERSRTFLMAAIAIAALTGTMGCAVSGISGILGMLIATALLSAPGWALART